MWKDRPRHDDASHSADSFHGELARSRQAESVGPARRLSRVKKPGVALPDGAAVDATERWWRHQL
jgi:hypothetical protein